MVTARDVFSDRPRVGMGCWAIGGLCEADGLAVGYGETVDVESRRSIEAAWDAGGRVVDRGAAYGGGHSERVRGGAIGCGSEASSISECGRVCGEARGRVAGGGRGAE